MEEKKSKVSAVFSKITTALLSVVLVISVLIIGFTIFHDNYYKTFWVNGQSMYPTLNSETTYSDGQLIGDTDIHQSVATYKKLDYGIMDTHKKTLDNLKRFDIVVCYYGENETDYKIKRLIVMPGETFYIVKNDVDNKEHNGDLYILNNETNEFEYIAQPFDEYYVRNGTYTLEYSNKDNPVTLADDEVFVMGDNRLGNHSSDSRKVGPIKYSSIEGKAVALEGTCEVKINESGEYVPKNIKRHWPRFL